ncbi:PilW family protein [Horticoccus sp. 23ND18S-11]|uniref:PilW family protein n=1 Tax=Horticoccus sp. 23ND18S-11 TaxID=3391832 RepID=UPI0039C9F6AE
MTLRPPPLRRRARSFFGARGFTLVEVLVATTITVVVAGFIVIVVSNVSGFWSRTSGTASAEGQGRFIIEQLTLDLQSALYHDDGKTWLAANVLANTNNTGLWNTTGTTASAIKPNNAGGSLQGIAIGALADARFGVAGTWLRFFTTKRGSNASLATASAPVAVSYQIVRRATSGNEARSTDRRYLLHRSEVTPANTLTAGFDFPATNSPYAPGRNTATVGSAAEVRYPTINSVIAENVVDFGVRLYVRDTSLASGLRQVFPTTNATLAYEAKSPASVPAAAAPFPEVADVVIRVLTDEGARILAGYEASPQRVTAPTGRTAQQAWWDIVLANSRVFTRRIVINSRTL